MTLINTSQTVVDRLEEVSRSLHSAPRQLQYAKDNADRMRVSVDTGTVTIGAVTMWSNGTYVTWYATGGGNSLDAREQYREQTVQSFNTGPRARWSFS